MIQRTHRASFIGWGLLLVIVSLFLEKGLHFHEPSSGCHALSCTHAHHHPTDNDSTPYSSCEAHDFCIICHLLHTLWMEVLAFHAPHITPNIVSLIFILTEQETVSVSLTPRLRSPPFAF